MDKTLRIKVVKCLDKVQWRLVAKSPGFNMSRAATTSRSIRVLLFVLAYILTIQMIPAKGSLKNDLSQRSKCDDAMDVIEDMSGYQNGSNVALGLSNGLLACSCVHPL